MRDIDVEYFRQERPPPPDEPCQGHGFLPDAEGVYGPVPVRLYTDPIRRRLNES